MRINRKKNMIMICIIILLCMGFGYAFLNTHLSIEGVADIKGIGNKGVYIDDESFQILEGSVTGEKVVQSPTVTENNLSFQVQLTDPGDYYSFTFNIVNETRANVMLDDVSIDASSTSDDDYNYYLWIDGSYLSGADINANQIIAANSTETVRMYVAYYETEFLQEQYLPTGNQVISFTGTLHFSDPNENAVEIYGTTYRFSEDKLKKGDTMPFLSFKNLNADLNALRTMQKTRYAIKHEVDGSKIISSSLAFKVNEIEYVINEESNYNEKVTILNGAFGIENCQESNLGLENNSTYLYVCRKPGDKNVVVAYTGDLDAILVADTETENDLNATRGCAIYENDDHEFLSQCSYDGEFDVET